MSCESFWNRIHRFLLSANQDFAPEFLGITAVIAQFYSNFHASFLNLVNASFTQKMVARLTSKTQVPGITCCEKFWATVGQEAKQQCHTVLTKSPSGWRSAQTIEAPSIRILQVTAHSSVPAWIGYARVTFEKKVKNCWGNFFFSQRGDSANGERALAWISSWRVVIPTPFGVRCSRKDVHWKHCMTKKEAQNCWMLIHFRFTPVLNVRLDTWLKVFVKPDGTLIQAEHCLRNIQVFFQIQPSRYRTMAWVFLPLFIKTIRTFAKKWFSFVSLRLKKWCIDGSLT